MDTPMIVLDGKAYKDGGTILEIVFPQLTPLEISKRLVGGIFILSKQVGIHSGESCASVQSNNSRFVSAFAFSSLAPT